ncbi:M20/M25/M40 family metallo-hydrolase [Streptosporangium sp. NPDC049046]|uniref:M28 family metallopeptidase n=1 Tax=Streptosporangium sp. NPDC049046 TaxID=3155031 RepID=UPI0034251601
MTAITAVSVLSLAAVSAATPAPADAAPVAGGPGPVASAAVTGGSGPVVADAASLAGDVAPVTKGSAPLAGGDDSERAAGSVTPAGAAPVSGGGDSAPPTGSPLPPEAKAFGASIKLAALRGHLERLQSIADANGGNRAAATPGYAASLAYVADRLREAGYRLTSQEFKISFFREVATPVLKRTRPLAKKYVPGTDFRTMTYSGSGEVTAPVQAVDLVLPPKKGHESTSGCEASDFSRFVRGNIALIQRGTCSFQAKAERAEAAGASGVIIFNDGRAEGADTHKGLFGGSINTSTVRIPVVSADFATGEQLAARGTTVALVVQTEIAPDRRTRNLIAESTWGDPDRVVMLGAHLDSVMMGPGINDNGSGTAGVLETALAAKSLRTKNRLRFAFWGAEELGLLGSKYYVSALPPAERAKVKLYLNFDMIASPNHVFGIYDGNSSGNVISATPPPGSGQIEKLLQAYFEAVGEPYQDADFSGRSDYGPFIGIGIPAGGLFTGAEGLKSTEEAKKFGGTAGVAYDKCYHQACDTIANINDKALLVNSGAIAAAAFTYGYADDLPHAPNNPPNAGDSLGSRGSKGSGVPGVPGKGAVVPGRPGAGAGGLESGHDHDHGGLLR